jgi:2,5-furandicarboxylate decarboxylase 1
MDFRTFVALLEAEDELLRVKVEVDPKHELSALLKQAEARRKAIYFENVKGSAFPVVGGVMTNPQRHALSVGKSPQQMNKPGAWAETLAAARTNPLLATIADSGPAATIIQQGGGIDLNKLPVPFSFSGDTHRFFTAGLGIVLDPETGIQNVGFYRAPLLDSEHLSISAGAASRLNSIYQDAAKNNKTLSMAFIIGAPPALLLTAGCRIKRDESDMDIAGALQGEPLELMRCQTSDLLVPAQAEFVIEVEVELDKFVDHTMGEFPDSYGVTRSPIARVTAVTHRSDAVFHTILGGMNKEHNSLGSYIFLGMRELLLEQLATEFPGLHDIHVDLTPPRMGGRCQINVSLDKQSAAEPMALINALNECKFDTYPLRLIAQRIVVVDKDVNIRDNSDIEWAIATRVTTTNQLQTVETPGRGGGTTIRLAIDATIDPENSGTTERPRITGAELYNLNDYV